MLRRCHNRKGLTVGILGVLLMLYCYCCYCCYCFYCYYCYCRRCHCCRWPSHCHCRSRHRYVTRIFSPVPAGRRRVRLRDSTSNKSETPSSFHFSSCLSFNPDVPRRRRCWLFYTPSDFASQAALPPLPLYNASGLQRFVRPFLSLCYLQTSDIPDLIAHHRLHHLSSTIIPRIL